MPIVESSSVPERSEADEYQVYVSVSFKHFGKPRQITKEITDKLLDMLDLNLGEVSFNITIGDVDADIEIEDV